MGTRKKGVGLSLGWFLFCWEGSWAGLVTSCCRKIHFSSSRSTLFPASKPCWCELPDPCPTPSLSLLPSLPSALILEFPEPIGHAPVPCVCVWGWGLVLMTFQMTACSLSPTLQMQTPLCASYSSLVSEDSISNCMRSSSTLVASREGALLCGPFSTSVASPLMTLLPASSHLQGLDLSVSHMQTHAIRSSGFLALPRDKYFYRIGFQYFMEYRNLLAPSVLILGEAQ